MCTAGRPQETLRLVAQLDGLHSTVTQACVKAGSFIFEGAEGVCSLPQHGIVDADESRYGGSHKDALVAAIHRLLEALDRGFGEEPVKGHALGVDDVRDERLRDAERQRVDDVLGSITPRPATHGRVARSAQVEEPASQTGQDEAGQHPGEGGRPEARRQQEEHVGGVDGVVGSAEGLDGGDGEGVRAGQDLAADAPQLEAGDAEEHAGHGAEGVASRMARLRDAAVLVDGRHALPDCHGRAVSHVRDIGRRCRQGNARCQMRNRARRRLDKRRRCAGGWSEW